MQMPATGTRLLVESNARSTERNRRPSAEICVSTMKRARNRGSTIR